MAEGRQTNQETRGGTQRSGPINMAASTLRGIGQFYDVQAATARMMFRAQARALCTLGLPDYSDLFQLADDRAKRACSSGTEHLLHTAEQAREAVSEVQRHIGRLMEHQAVNLAETWQQGLEEWQAQASQSLDEFRELARQQAEEAARATESLTRVTRETLREGGEQFRETVRKGFEQGREAMGEQEEVLRRQGERAAGEARNVGREAQEAATEPAERSGRRGKAA